MLILTKQMLPQDSATIKPHKIHSTVCSWLK